MAASAKVVEAIIERIREERNFDFRNYKRATLARRIERRMADRGKRTGAGYLELLDKDVRELDALISALLIKVTSFFRDRELWHDLSTRIIPLILANKRAGEEVRVWSAGCSTGEEAFSLAILFAEALGPAFGRYELKVFGTDLDDKAIAAARRGVFGDEQMKSVPRKLAARWFTRTADGHVVKQEIRRLVVFGVNNLVSDAPISRLDLLTCRNVFIYLDTSLQKRVLTRFHYALAPGGVLVLGRAELIPFAAKTFDQVDLGLRIYRKDGRLDLPAAASAGGALDQVGPAPRAAAEPPRADRNGNTVEVCPIPMIAVDRDDAITIWNAAASRLWGIAADEVLGKKLTSLGLAGLVGSEVGEKLGLVRDGKRDRQTFDAQVAEPGRQGTFVIDVVPLQADGATEVTGLLLVASDVTGMRALEGDMRRVGQELRNANLRLQRTNEELRTSNEELETTNEELQSANEELQTTNEELQSTNEELETTNEELQSANAELDATNRELAHRTQEMNLMALYHRTIIRSLSAAIVVTDPVGKISSWNLAAERLLGLPESEALGHSLWGLRIPALGRPLVQRIKRALAERLALREVNVEYELPTGGGGLAAVAAIPLVDADRSLGAVVIFEDSTRAGALHAENSRLKGLLGKKKNNARTDGHVREAKPQGPRRD